MVFMKSSKRSTGNLNYNMILVIFQIEYYNVSIDNTAVNVIRLLCREPCGDFPEIDNVTSSTLPLGNVFSAVYCPAEYWVVQFKVRMLQGALLDAFDNVLLTEVDINGCIMHNYE